MNAAPSAPYVVPATFEQDTIFVEPVTTAGQRLHFYTDTGGDDWMFRAEAVNIGLVDADTHHANEWISAPLPRFRDDAWIPSPLDGGSIMLNPHTQDRTEDGPSVGTSGLLGQGWFGRYIWEIDYKDALMIVHTTRPTGIHGVAVPLAFAEVNGRRANNFPRIQAIVEGEPLNLLFDTGAHTQLTAEAATCIGAAELVRATSFIIDSIARRWRAQHPHWPVIERGEARSGADMIQVPSVQVGGLDTGPVWFTQRRDRNFIGYMSQWMDKTIVGALGGNALRNFRIVLDYQAAQVHLQSKLMRLG
jgi:hypothetical protein